MRREICIVTGSRADYGNLKPLIEEIRSDKDLKLQLVVTGMHLSPEFGLTYKYIEKDRLRIEGKVKIDLSSDTPASISKAIGVAIIGFSKVYDKIRPDIIVVLGDRFEIFSAVASAAAFNIPVAHICGGEITEGAFDDYFRHAITKMAHIHFTTAEVYRRRVIQMGERPENVYNVGALSIDSIKKNIFLSRQELKKKFHIKLNKRNFIITFHSVTLEKGTSKKYFEQLLLALDTLKDASFIFTKTNADTGGRVINCLIDNYVKRNQNKAVSFVSMGQQGYLSTMRFMNAVVGNSSSGIVEAPFLNIPTINIGIRQKGRIRVNSIIDCEPKKESICRAFNKVCSKSFLKKIRNTKNPYGDGCAARKIKNILKGKDISNILKKSFYNIL